CLVGWYLSLYVRPRCSALFPYSTLFRSHGPHHLAVQVAQDVLHQEGDQGLVLDDEHAQITQTLPRLRQTLHHDISPMTTSHSWRSEEHTSELQSRENLVCRLLLEKKNNI